MKKNLVKNQRQNDNDSEEKCVKQEFHPAGVVVVGFEFVLAHCYNFRNDFFVQTFCAFLIFIIDVNIAACSSDFDAVFLVTP